MATVDCCQFLCLPIRSIKVKPEEKKFKLMGLKYLFVTPNTSCYNNIRLRAYVNQHGLYHKQEKSPWGYTHTHTHTSKHLFLTLIQLTHCIISVCTICTSCHCTKCTPKKHQFAYKTGGLFLFFAEVCTVLISVVPLFPLA